MENGLKRKKIMIVKKNKKENAKPNPQAWYYDEAIKKRYPFISHGKKVFIAHSAFIDYRAPIKIGDKATICDWVKILTHDYSSVMRGQSEEVAGREIGNNVFIGIQAIILPGTIIGDNVFIGAGAVVDGKLETGVYAGNPAKRIGDFKKKL